MSGVQYPRTQNLPPELPHHPLPMIRVPLRIAQMIVYFFMAGNALTSYQRSIRHLFSETSRISLTWVRWLINGYMVLLLFMVGLYLLILQHPEQFGLIILINTALVTPYMYAVTFKSVTQPTLWQIRQDVDKEKVEEEMHTVEEIVLHHHGPKSQRATLTPEKKDDIAAKTIEAGGGGIFIWSRNSFLIHLKTFCS